MKKKLLFITSLLAISNFSFAQFNKPQETINLIKEEKKESFMPITKGSGLIEIAGFVKAINETYKYSSPYTTSAGVIDGMSVSGMEMNEKIFYGSFVFDKFMMGIGLSHNLKIYKTEDHYQSISTTSARYYHSDFTTNLLSLSPVFRYYIPITKNTTSFSEVYGSIGIYNYNRSDVFTPNIKTYVHNDIIAAVGIGEGISFFMTKNVAFQLVAFLEFFNQNGYSSSGYNYQKHKAITPSINYGLQYYFRK